jgi:hypothetical protein
MRKRHNKLQLGKETVRTLSDSEAVAVAGGANNQFTVVGKPGVGGTQLPDGLWGTAPAWL